MFARFKCFRFTVLFIFTIKPTSLSKCDKQGRFLMFNISMGIPPIILFAPKMTSHTIRHARRNHHHAEIGTRPHHCAGKSNRKFWTSAIDQPVRPRFGREFFSAVGALFLWHTIWLRPAKTRRRTAFTLAHPDFFRHHDLRWRHQTQPENHRPTHRRTSLLRRRILEIGRAHV